MRSILLWAIAITTLTACGKGGAEAQPEEADKPVVAVQIADVTTRPIRKLVTLSGSFVPGQGSAAHLAPAVAGRVLKVLVREGDHVNEGQLLATLDIRVQQSQQSSAAAGLDAARAQAAQSRLTYEAAVSDQQASVRSAQIVLEQARLQRDTDVNQTTLAYVAARADLAKLRAGARPQEVAQAHEFTVQTQAARDRAAAEYRRNEDLWPSGYVSKRQLEDAKTALDTAESALTAAQASESLVKEGARPEDLRASQAKTAASRDALASAKSIGAQRVAAAESALKQAQAATVTVQAKLKDVQASEATSRQRAADSAAAAATTSLGEIRAPFPGTISRRLLNPGDPADTTTTVLEISRASGSTDFLAAALPAEAQSIRAGLTVDLSFSERTASGRVTSVSAADPQTGLCNIRISCDHAPLAGTFGTAHIVADTLPKAIAVPDAALLNRDGKVEVLRDLDGTAKETTVTVGSEDNGFTAILSGLRVGEKVVLLGGNELDDGAKIKPEEPKKDSDDAGGKEPGS